MTRKKIKESYRSPKVKVFRVQHEITILTNNSVVIRNDDSENQGSTLDIGTVEGDQWG